MIRFDKVGFSYQTDTETSPKILGEVSFSLETGECLGLAGNNGSGKSTIALLAKGLLLPSQGVVTVDGVDTRTMDENVRARVGLLFQNPDNQIVGTTAREDIAFGLENLGVNSAEIEKTINEQAVLFGLENVLDTPIHALSGGTRQRVALAAVFAAQPRFIVLDEPTSQLDPWARISFWQFLQKIKERNDIGLLLISQHNSDLLQADRVMSIENGQLTDNVKLENIFNNIKHNSQADLVNLQDSVNDTSEFEHVLTIENLTVGYGKNPVVRDLCASFKTGKVHLIVGPSGCGKTTLLSSIAGFLPPLKGKTTFDGEEWNPEGRVGMVFQNPEHLFFCSTVGEEVCAALNKNYIDREKIIEKGKAWLNTWGLDAEKFWDRSPFHLSGGEMRRAALAACTVEKRDVILLDEPLAGLDAPGKVLVANIIAAIAKKYVVVIVTHELEEMLSIGGCVLLLHGGAGRFFENIEGFVAAVKNAPPLFPLLSGLCKVDIREIAVSESGFASLVTFVENKSYLSQIHPMVKGASAFGVILMQSFCRTPAYIALLWIIIPPLLAGLAGAPLRKAFYNLRSIWLLMIIVGTIDIAVSGFAALPAAVVNIFRLAGVFVIATLYVDVSNQSELMYFLEKCFRPLKSFGFNVREPALAMVVAMRFLPVMFEEADRIHLAQRARGIKVEKNCFTAIFSVFSLLVPTLYLAIRRAGILALAMEARGYCLEGIRTQYKTYNMKFYDYALVITLALFTILSILISIKAV